MHFKEIRGVTMLRDIREFQNELEEEVKYRDQIESHLKSLSTTLWGLEEQSQYPENSGKEDQIELSEQVNTCRIKQMSCVKLVKSHDSKLVRLFEKFTKELLINPKQEEFSPEGSKHER